MAICANCGAEVPPRSRFCGACGASVAVAVEHHVRKVVTVLFCDVAGSTALGERHDAERMRRVLGRYFEAIERVIEGHGGLVEKFVGDAVMAVFGLPGAHEDDALRAVRAAQEMQELLPRLGEETGLELAFRTGVNTGEVVAGTGQTLVTGGAVNVAARLEEAAAPGEILLGAETVRLLRDAVRVEPLAPLAVRGKAAPVAAFRFRELVAAEPREASAFVDRARELALLREAFGRAWEERELHLFTLLGPAGIGKSRLASEFTGSLTAEARVVRGRCLSYGRGITYWPLVEILRGLGEPAQPALERVVSGGATSGPQLAWTVQQALERAALERPLVVVLEDLHWGEPALLDLLDLVAELSRGAPIMLLCIARLELLEGRPGWGAGKPNVTSVLLAPLPESDSELLLTGLERSLEPAQRRRVLEIAGGNPLFLQELSAYLVDGGGDGELPPRIHAVLQARLDLLAEAEHHVLACAAVAGTVVHRGSLERMLGNAEISELSSLLTALTRKRLIRPGPAELEGEEGFCFRHQLIRDTAYAALPKEERALLHERFADWLDERTDERLRELVAYHLEQAALCKRELGMSEPALETRAATALAAAGERARMRTDFGAAAGLWRRALVLFDPDDPRVPELELELAFALVPLGRLDDASRLLEHAGGQTADPCVAAAIRLVGLYARLHRSPEVAPDAIRGECATAIPLFEQRGDHRQLARAWYMLALAEIAELQVEAAGQAWAEAAAHAKLAGDRWFEIWIWAESTERVYGERMPWAAGVRELERLATEFPGEPLLDVALCVNRALAAQADGRREDARAFASEGLDVSRRLGATVFTALHTALFGVLAMLSGELDEGERLALTGIRELRAYDEHLWLSWVLALLANIRVEQGRSAEALELADEAEQQGRHDRRTLVAVDSSRARAYLRLGAIDEAKAAARNAVALADTTDSLLHRGHALYALAEVLAATEELTAALTAAREAVRLYTTLERTGFAQRATVLAEQIERAVHGIALATVR